MSLQTVYIITQSALFGPQFKFGEFDGESPGNIPSQSAQDQGSLEVLGGFFTSFTVGLVIQFRAGLRWRRNANAGPKNSLEHNNVNKSAKLFESFSFVDLENSIFQIENTEWL